MQTEERKQFHLNPQVLVMVAVIFLALALPVAAVVGFVIGTYKIQRAPAAQAPSAEAEAALQRSLEEAAQKNLAPESLNEPAVEVMADDLPAKREQIVKLAEVLGGSAVVMGDDKIWAQVPENQVGLFKKACAGSENPAPGEKKKDLSLILVEVILKPKST